MSGNVETIFKVTVGLLANKARTETVEQPEDCDVTDPTFRDFIVGQIEHIKTKLDGLARKNLLPCISFLKEGIVILNQALVKTHKGNSVPEGSETVFTNEPATDRASLVTSQIVKDLQPTDPKESGEKLLADAKERFKAARLEATMAFSNEDLTTSDRILALKIKLMATILERVDRPADAIEECKLCLENLHAMPAVRENFKIQLTEARGLKARFHKEEREAVFVAVHEANDVVLRVIQVIDDENCTETLPPLEVGSERVDVLHDLRVLKKLEKLEKEHHISLAGIARAAEAAGNRVIGATGRATERVAERLSSMKNNFRHR